MSRLLVQIFFALLLFLVKSFISSVDEGELTKICFEKDNLCYFFKEDVTSFEDVSQLQEDCPKGTFLISVFNKSMQYHLQTIIIKLVDEGLFTKIVLSLKNDEMSLYWMFGKESKVPVTYGNWRSDGHRMGKGDCVFVSEAYGYKWQISSCGGLATMVCMSKMCSLTWETIDGGESNFESGTRMTGISNVDDCKFYCEILGSGCIGVYMSYWNHCWHFSKIVSRKSTGDDDEEFRKLYIKSSDSVCPSRGEIEVEGSHVWDEELNAGDARIKRQANRTTRRPRVINNDSEQWHGEPAAGREEKSSLEKVYTMMSILTYASISSIATIRIVTWIVIKLKKKKEKVADDAAN